MKKLLSEYKKPGLLVLVLALLLAGVAQSQAARNLLGWSPAAPKEKGETPSKGRERREIAPPAPSTATASKETKDGLRAAREQAQLSRVPTSHVNLVDLLAESDVIVRGEITHVRDGLHEGYPYTQVTLRVGEALRGETGGEFTFRQFGLLKPRPFGPGKKEKMLNLTPAGWATYKTGEEVVLFLAAAGTVTGFRAPIGLEQGKFTLQTGNASNAVNNAGIFLNMETTANSLTEKEQTVLRTEQGPMNAEAFMSLVRRAVTENLVERGLMRHVQQ